MQMPPPSWHEHSISQSLTASGWCGCLDSRVPSSPFDFQNDCRTCRKFRSSHRMPSSTAIERRLDVLDGDAHDRCSGQVAAADPRNRLHQRPACWLREQEPDRRLARKRIRNRARAAACSTSARHASRARRRRTCRRCSARRRWRVNARSEVREAYSGYRTAYDLAASLPRRNRPAAKAHLRGEPASLQRHAHRRLRAAGRCARAGRKRDRVGRGAARLLDRRDESADRA